MASVNHMMALWLIPPQLPAIDAVVEVVGRAEVLARLDRYL